MNLTVGRFLLAALLFGASFFCVAAGNTVFTSPDTGYSLAFIVYLVAGASFAGGVVALYER